jgi:probable rRNA maturation factor
LLGVIVVSVETVKRETAGLGYGIEEGLLYYVIHGLLHLQGYEHVGVPAAEARRMEQRQEEIFESVLALQAGRLG